LFPYCKKCTIKASNKYQLEHVESTAINKAKWRKEHSDIQHERDRKWKSENKEHWEEYKAKWNQLHPKWRTEYQRERKHRKHKITNAEWVKCKEYFNNSCAYCGMSESEHIAIHNQKLHKEHVKSDGDNTIHNCIPSCKICNSQKWAYEFEDWYNENNTVFSTERLNKILDWIFSDSYTIV
jgi:biotin synthase-like enzyme